MRSALEARGVDLTLKYAFDLIGNAAGGLSRGLAPMGAADLSLEANLETLLGWPGARLRLYAIGNHSRSLSAQVGDAQVVDNIEAPSAFRLFEAWLQQTLGTPKVTLRGGLYDVNTEFDVIPSAALFLHSSPGMGAAFGNAGTNGPSSFPVTSLTLRLDARPRDWFYVRAAVAEGVPGDPAEPRRMRVNLRAGEGALVVAELGIHHLSEPEVDSRQRRFEDPLESGQQVSGEGWYGKYALGGWGFTGQVSPVWDHGVMQTTSPRRGSYGAYVIASQRLFSEHEAPDQGLTLYVRPGVADRRISLFDAYLGAGLVYRGALLGRDHDRMGLALAAAHLGPAYIQDLRRSGARTAPWEVVLELTYRAGVLHWLSVQPDIQLVVHPGGRADLAPAVVAGARVIVRL